nr:MAG TPA: hypothetical protein [Caudoviricetes sp.]
MTRVFLIGSELAANYFENVFGSSEWLVVLD